MAKKCLISLITCALIFLGGCEGLPYSTNVFSAEAPPPVLVKSGEKSPQPGAPVNIIPEPIPQCAYAGIVDPDDLVSIKTILKKISQPEVCSRVILIAQKEGLKIDHPVYSELSLKFPESQINTVFVDPESSREELDKQLGDIVNNLGEFYIILVVTDFSVSADSKVQAYRNSFINDLLFNADTASFKNLPQKNNKHVILFGSFLDKLNLKKIAAKDWGDSSLNILYQKGEQSQKERVTFMVALGDIMLGRDVRSLMNAHGLNYPFSLIDPYYLKANDVLLGNLEGPIAKNAVKTSKTIAFRFMPDIAPVLKGNFFDVLSLANNHALDMGVQGYKDSIQVLADNGIIPFGDPRGINSESIAYTEINGMNFAFLGLEEVIYKIDDDKAVAKIKEMVAQGYTVIPVVHWGIEYKHKPSERQKELAHKLIDAGAVMIIGHHPHVVQSFERYNGHPIFYSLGNAIFDQYFSADTQEGLSIGLIIKPDSIESYLFPIKIDRARMRLMTAEEKEKFLERFISYGDFDETLKNEIRNGQMTNIFSPLPK